LISNVVSSLNKELAISYYTNPEDALAWLKSEKPEKE
jgi:hypothetical protein